MSLKKFLRANGVNTLIIIAGIVVFYFGLIPEGKTMAKALLQDSPVLFYTVFVPFTLTFTAWIIIHLKKRFK